MKKRKLNITLITNNEKEEYSLLGSYDLEKEIILYQESKSLLTEVELNLKEKTLIRKNKDYELKYLLLEKEETENEIKLKDLNQSVILKIKTEKFQVTNNKIEIIYTILDSNEKINYKIEF
jgi:hypothetical protein